ERILVIADYDADGATACAVAVRGLAAMGAVVEFLVPTRVEYGYGLTPEMRADAAGATACAVAGRGLAAMGAVVEFLVPNRFEYGYGLTPEIVVDAAARAPRLIVTV